MKFKLDENLPTDLRDDLRALGHDAEMVYDEGLAGAVEAVILGRVKREGRVFLTMDKGVADVRTYPPAAYAGLVLFRPASSGRGVVLAFVRRHLPILLQADLVGHLLVVTERSIRIR